jgi:hypothetical protein
MLQNMAERNFPGTFEYDVCKAGALATGQSFDAQSTHVPIGLLAQRDLTVGIPSAGGNLVGAKTAGFRDVLWEKSTAMRLGIQVEENLVSDLLIPTVTNPAGPGDAPNDAQIATGEWLATEESALTPSNVTIGTTASRPKTGGGMLKTSYNFYRHSQQAEAFTRNHLLSMMGNLVDRAVFQGTGSEGQPRGLLYTPGLSVSGTGEFQHTEASGMVTAIANEGSQDGDIKFLASPNVRHFMTTERLSKGGTYSLWRENAMVSTPALASYNCPEYLFCGDWTQIMLAIWGAGPRIEVDPYTLFKTGGVQVRVLVHADVIVHRPRNFCKWGTVFDTP